MKDNMFVLIVVKKPITIWHIVRGKGQIHVTEAKKRLMGTEDRVLTEGVQGTEQDLDLEAGTTGIRKRVVTNGGEDPGLDHEITVAIDRNHSRETTMQN